MSSVNHGIICSGWVKHPSQGLKTCKHCVYLSNLICIASNELMYFDLNDKIIKKQSI